MLTNAQELMYEAPMLMVYPGLLIFLTVMAFNVLGDGLQDALDPLQRDMGFGNRISRTNDTTC
jgi:peptide/nickel transport system permease protein